MRSGASEAKLWVPDQVLGVVGGLFCDSFDSDKWFDLRDGLDPHMQILMATAA